MTRKERVRDKSKQIFLSFPVGRISVFDIARPFVKSQWEKCIIFNYHSGHNTDVLCSSYCHTQAFKGHHASSWHSCFLRNQGICKMSEGLTYFSALCVLGFRPFFSGVTRSASIKCLHKSQSVEIFRASWYRTLLKLISGCALFFLACTSDLVSLLLIYKRVWGAFFWLFINRLYRRKTIGFDSWLLRQLYGLGLDVSPLCSSMNE